MFTRAWQILQCTGKVRFCENLQTQGLVLHGTCMLAMAPVGACPGFASNAREGLHTNSVSNAGSSRTSTGQTGTPIWHRLCSADEPLGRHEWGCLHAAILRAWQVTGCQNVARQAATFSQASLVLLFQTTAFWVKLSTHAVRTA